MRVTKVLEVCSKDLISHLIGYHANPYKLRLKQTRLLQDDLNEDQTVVNLLKCKFGHGMSLLRCLNMFLFPMSY